MTRADLIAALEKAEGPSRELDCEILQAAGLPEMFFGSEVVMWWRDGDNWRCETANGYLHSDALFTPRYTASIDAALPWESDLFWEISGARTYLNIPTPVPNKWHAVAWPKPLGENLTRAEAWAATEAIARRIAALKAAAPIDTERPLTDEDRAAIASDPFAAWARLLEPDAKTRQRLFITLGESREPTKTATQIKHEADVAALKARE